MFDFTRLINALFGRSKPEGLRDLQSATQMMLQLPESEVLTAQAEIIKGLKQLNTNTSMSVRERFRTIDYLDGKARKLQLHLLDIYQGRVIDRSAPPKQVLLIIMAFWAEMGNAYRQALKHYQANPHRSISPEQLRQFVLRGMIYFAEQAKWAHIRYLKVDTAVWRNLNRFYVYAEQHGFERDVQHPYEDAVATSVAREYGATLMLSLSAPDKLLPKQVELVASWLHHWADGIELGREIRPHHHLFAINLDTQSPPRRLRRDMHGTQWRYGASASLVSQASEALDVLLHGGKAEELGLPPASSDPVNTDLLRRLISLWSREMPLPIRRHERRQSKKPVGIVRGIDAVIRRLQKKGQSEEEALAQWVLDNESDSGFGIQFRNGGNEHFKVGEIIGLVSEQQPQAMTIGVIRRMARQADGRLEAGIETLSKTPLVVELSSLNARQGIQVLYSPDDAHDNRNRFLLVPDGVYAETSECKLAAQGRAYRIRLTGARERANKAAVADFAVLGRLPA